MDTNEALLRAILATIARQTFPPAELTKIVSPKSGGEKQYHAYNLCNGHNSQAEIAKKVGFDKGSLSRSISRWIEAGIVLRVGADEKPLHLYPLPKEKLKG